MSFVSKGTPGLPDTTCCATSIGHNPGKARYLHRADLVQNNDNFTGGLERQTAVKDRTEEEKTAATHLQCLAVKVVNAYPRWLRVKHDYPSVVAFS